MDKLQSLPPTTPVPPIEPRPDCITQVFNLYHIPSDDDPEQATLQQEHTCQYPCQPYKRRIIIGEEWQPLLPSDCWVEQPSGFALLNRRGYGRVTNPTEKEKEEDKLSMLQVITSLPAGRDVPPDRCSGGLIAPASGFVVGTPGDWKQCFVRSIHEQIEATIWITPK